MTDQDPGPERRIARVIRRRIDAGARTIAARRLSGGASQDTWLIETEDARYVLRRAPEAVSAPNPFAVGSGAEVQVSALLPAGTTLKARNPPNHPDLGNPCCEAATLRVRVCRCCNSRV